MNIVFFGTSNVALPILETLNQHHTVAGAVTSPDALVGRKKELTESPVSVLAKEMNLPLFKPEKVKGNQEFFGQLKSLAADIFVVVSYGKILPMEIFDMPRYKTLNVHFSLLPKYRGASPIQYALLNGETQTGTSVIILDEQVDHGPVIAWEKHSIDADDNFITLSEKLAQASARLLESVLPDYAAGKLELKVQQESQASYTKIITRADGKVDWTRSAAQIYNQFRAFYPWPGLWTTWNGQTLKIKDCFPAKYAVSSIAPAGTVLNEGLVACGEGSALKLSVVQLEGKTETAINSFLNGYPGFVGSKLE